MPPQMEGYRPFGISGREQNAIVLLFEEYEAIRLIDYEDLTQLEAAEIMGISRPTFTRLYDKARKNIAKAFIEGKAIIISGGKYIMDSHWYRCRDCSETMNSTVSEDHCRSCDSKNIIPLN